MQRHDVVVAHSLKRWLPQTEAWQFCQIISIPDGIRNCVVCEFLENTDCFSLSCRDHMRSLGANHSGRGFGGSFKTAKKWSKRYRNIKYRKYLLKQIRYFGAQVLHSHFGNNGWFNIGVAKKTQIKHIVSFYGMDAGYLPMIDSRWVERYRDLFCSVDLVLVEGPNMANRIKQMGCPGEKVRIHHLGVMLDRLPFRVREKRKTDPIRVLIAASFREKKGITYAVEALKRFNRVGRVVVTIIGDDNGSIQSLREKQKILEAVDGLGNKGLGSKVRITGFLTHDKLIAEAYKHHVFLSPSVTASDGDIEGGAPVTLIEMAATGMMVVSTRHCDIPHIVKDGKTGFLANERDIGGLAEHLNWLNNNPGSWEKVARASRVYIEQNFNARKQGEILASIYKNLSRHK